MQGSPLEKGVSSLEASGSKEDLRKHENFVEQMRQKSLEVVADMQSSKHKQTTSSMGNDSFGPRKFKKSSNVFHTQIDESGPEGRFQADAARAINTSIDEEQDSTVDKLNEDH